MAGTAAPNHIKAVIVSTAYGNIEYALVNDKDLYINGVYWHHAKWGSTWVPISTGGARRIYAAAVQSSRKLTE